MKEVQRLHFLDALRGWAAFLVVIYHYTGDLMYEGSLHGAELWLGKLFEGSLNIGKYGVVLFFLISGYIIPNSLGSSGDRIGRFCISRFFRLYPLYWMALAIGILLYEVDPQSSLTRAAILANTTMAQGYMGQPDIVLSAWTLQIELTFYTCCVAMAALHKMSSPRACAVASVGFLALSLAMAIARNELVMKLPLALPLALTLNFFATVWRQATLVGLPEARRLAPWLLGVITVTLVPICLIGYDHDFGFHESWQQYIICYLAAILTFVVCTTRLRIAWRPVVWLGEISYSVYLLHPLISTAAYQAGWTASGLGVDPALYIAGLMLIVMPCAWLTYRFVERPCIRLGNRLIHARQATLPGQTAAVPPL